MAGAESGEISDLSGDEFEEQNPLSVGHTTTRPYCLAGAICSWILWSDEPGLCLPQGQLGRVEYVGRHCGSNRIQWTRAATLDRAKGLLDWQCEWDWMSHPDRRKFAGDGGTAPSISGGQSLPTICLDSSSLPTTFLQYPQHPEVGWHAMGQRVLNDLFNNALLATHIHTCIHTYIYT